MNSIRASLDAIRAALHGTFPTYPIYVNDVPQDFHRPSFFVALVGAPASAMSATLRDVKPTWQLVFFPPLHSQATLAVDRFALYDMHDRLLQLFGGPLWLRTPGGQVLDIEAFDGAPREDAGYYTLRLDAQHLLRPAEGELVREIAVDINMKE